MRTDDESPTLFDDVPIPGAFTPTAPPTTVAAATAIDVRSQLGRTYRAIADSGSLGATGPEIADRVGLSVSLVSTRIKTLHIRGLVDYARLPDGELLTRRSAPSGMAARVHVATARP